MFLVSFESLVGLIILPFFIVVLMLLVFLSELFLSGSIIRLFGIQYKEGTYEYSVRENAAFKWMLICQLYTPMRKLLEMIPLGGMQRSYLRLLGMKIGKNTLVGGVIKDPCLTELGANTTVGEYAVLYAHLHDYNKGTITFSKIRVGDRCVVGAGAIIMPGVRIENDTLVGAGAIVPKNHVLSQGKIYVGNPAGELGSSQKPSS